MRYHFQTASQKRKSCHSLYDKTLRLRNKRILVSLLESFNRYGLVSILPLLTIILQFYNLILGICQGKFLLLSQSG